MPEIQGHLARPDGHTIELVRNNWNKPLKLLIDGQEVASDLRLWPHTITLIGTFEHGGVQQTVVAKSVVRFPSADDTIAIDGKALTLTKTK